MDEDYLTIRQAAEWAGYTGTTNLYAAARSGRLKTITMGPLNTRVTTPAWMDEYLGSLQASKGRRGQPRTRGRAVA